jgi:hypothetical protein
METLDSDRDILRKLFTDWQTWPKKAAFQLVPTWDIENNRYLLLAIGWDGYQRLHEVFVHVELHDGLFWIEADQTPEGFALDLEAAGIPKERIVLAFKHPELRRFSEYAQAA